MRPALLMSCASMVLGVVLPNSAPAQDQYEFIYDFGTACG